MVWPLAVKGTRPATVALPMKGWIALSTKSAVRNSHVTGRTSKGLPFNDLKELCLLTDGNLNRHLMVLEKAGLVAANRAAKRAGRRQWW